MAPEDRGSNRRHVTAEPHDLPSWDEFSGRNDPSQRFRIYCVGIDGERNLIATVATPEAVGVALVTLGREGQFADCAVGILDTEGEVGQKWVLRPWRASAKNVSDAGRVLGSARKKTPDAG